MKYIDNYKNLVIEKNILLERLKMILEYEETIISEKSVLEKLLKKQEETIKLIENDLKELNGIENKLFKEIVINGINVSKAIEKIAEEEEKDVSTLWKNYYPKVKEKIDIIIFNK